MIDYGVIAAGIATILGVLFKGKFVVLAREQEREKQACNDLCDEKDKLLARVMAENQQLQSVLEVTRAELKEQIDANTTLYREVLGTITWLQSLAGLAAADRRGGGDGPNARRPDTRS